MPSAIAIAVAPNSRSSAISSISQPAGLPLVPGGQGGRRFSGFDVGCGFAIWGPFRVQASVKAPESCAWSTRSEGGRNLLGRNLDGNQIARKYRTCAGHADLLFRDGGKRQAGKCDCLLEFTSRPELSLRAARIWPQQHMPERLKSSATRNSTPSKTRLLGHLQRSRRAQKRGEHARKRLTRFAGKIGTIGSIARLGRRSPSRASTGKIVPPCR